MITWKERIENLTKALGRSPSFDELLIAADAMFTEVMLGGPERKQPQRALRYRDGQFETVELDDNGRVIEPPPRCCYGRVLHAPNCKTWRNLT